MPKLPATLLYVKALPAALGKNTQFRELMDRLSTYMMSVQVSAVNVWPPNLTVWSRSRASIDIGNTYITQSSHLTALVVASAAVRRPSAISKRTASTSDAIAAHPAKRSSPIAVSHF